MNSGFFGIGLRIALAGTLVVIACGRAQQIAAPDRAPLTQAEQAKLLDGMRAYAEEYMSNLPNFICDLTVRQFEAGKKAKHWKQGDTLASKLVFDEGREQRSLERVNDRPAAQGRRGRTPLITEGEFGILMSDVFGAASNAAFTFRGWELLRGKWLTIFDYSIDREHSTLKLSLSDLGQAIVPYRGSVYADPADGVIWRIGNSATEIPPEIRTKSIATTVDYGGVVIGKSSYLLPVWAVVQLDTGSGNIKNEMEFGNYRKFESNSTIVYSSEDAHDKGNSNQPQ